ncbi:hypothetical protein PoB_004023400 [Plakobranchus ocellatus]|uniref:Uncharacterized protein n=1 Tax=Plakobranchus ocellatus TaxID=259542 RepID=A0AAV4B139_9GAST|nr:hypothetical protein PoB_004023400 [Plakobranchus ocellatus]
MKYYVDRSRRDAIVDMWESVKRARISRELEEVVTACDCTYSDPGAKKAGFSDGESRQKRLSYGQCMWETSKMKGWSSSAFGRCYIEGSS